MALSPLRGALRAALFLVLTAILFLVFMIARCGGRRATLPVRRWWCRATAHLLGVRIRSRGRPFTACPTLYVANHVSYLDILALGALTDGTFIAKAEIASWPLFGTLGRITRTFFVRRHWRHALIQRNDLAARLRTGESFVLFGEGTSSNGLAVLPLKTSLLSVAEPRVLDCPIAVQPITLAYVRLGDGTLVTPETCDLYAWHGAAAFLPHLWRALQACGVEIEVIVGNAVLSWSVRSRKILGRELRMQLSSELAAARLAGCAAPAADLVDVPGGGLTMP